MTEQRYIRLQEEDEYGVLETTDPWIKDLIFQDEDYTTETEWAEEELANLADIREARQATIVGEGSIEMDGRIDELLRVMKLVLGEVADSAEDGDAKEYIFIPDRDTVPHFGVIIGREEDEFQYLGQVANELELNSEVGENLMVTFTSLGKAPESDDVNEKFTGNAIVSDEDNIDLSDLAVMATDEVTVHIGNEKREDLQAANITLNNNLDDDYHVLGANMFTQPLVGQRREVEAALDFKHEDTELYKDFMDDTRVTLKKAYKMDEMVGGHNYEMEVILPELQYREYDGTISSRDTIRSTLTGRALSDEYTIASADLEIIDTDVTVQSDMIVRIVADVD